MSSSYSCATELRALANRLHEEANKLVECADVLDTLRDTRAHEEAVRRAHLWASEWLRSDLAASAKMRRKR